MQLYDVELESGDVVVFGSDGLFDNVWDHDIAAVVTDSISVRAPTMPGTSVEMAETSGMRCSDRAHSAQSS